MKKYNIVDMLIYVVISEFTGVLSSILSGGFSDFFDKFKEPPLLPPSWLFPVVWVLLYAVMGISAYLISVSEHNIDARKKALTIYYVQLALNFLWSIIFFRFEALWLAVVVVLALWVLIIAMILSFRKISPLAAYLNIPYLIWVTFASYLTIAIAVIN